LKIPRLLIAVILFEAALITHADLSAQTILIDFEAVAGLPGGNWNTVSVSGATGLRDFVSGAATSVGIHFTGDIAASTSTGAWGTREIAPDWTGGITDPALGDRLWIAEGGSGTLTLSGLEPGKIYDVEIASSYGGTGSSGNDVGIYELTDAAGLVAGVNAYSLNSLGSSVSWIPRMTVDDDPAKPVSGATEGWLGWYGAVADSAGELNFHLAAPSGANPRIALNAMQITATGEGVDLPLLLSMTGTGTFCPEDGERVFGVEGPTEPDVTYTLFRDGVVVLSLGGNEAALSFAVQTLPGTYTATAARDGIVIDLPGSATIHGDCPPPPVWPVWSEMPRIQVETDTNSTEYPNFPDPLRWFDFATKSVHGPLVMGPVEWYFGRRLEIIEMLEHYMYGNAPSAPGNPSFAVVESLPGHVGGRATRLKVILDTGVPGVATLPMYVYLPDNDNPPFPVIACLAKTKNPDDWEPGGARADRWHMEQTFNRGYALAIMAADEVAGDIHNSDRWRDPVVQPYANAGFAGDWQIIGAWAWGLSRMIDYLDTNPLIDQDRTIITGFSRRGKACLWTGALDERVELVAPHQTGSGGLAPNRPGWGTALTFRTQFPNWFLGSFNGLPMGETDNGYERLPFDQHFPVALVAPRWMFMDSNATYGSNLAGFEAIRHAAAPVFELLDPGNPDHLTLNWDFLNPNIHQFEAYHWAGIMDQADQLPLAMGGIRSFLEWRVNSGYFTERETLDEAMSGLTADPDKDGLSNLMEFATGSDPRSSSGEPVRLAPVDNGGLEVSFNVRDGGRGHPGAEYNAGGIAYRIEVLTTKGGNWQPLGMAEITWSLESFPNAPGWARLALVHHPINLTGHIFYRLSVSLY